MNYRFSRKKMVDYLESEIKIRDKYLLSVMNDVPRERFIDSALAGMAYKDISLPIGYHQTISKPSTVARMIEALYLNGIERVLEIGTGSGYQTAILAKMVKEVYTIELLPQLYEQTGLKLDQMGFRNIYRRLSDGYLGWDEQKPFQRIVITAYVKKIPERLIDQLSSEYGRIVFPMGTDEFQELNVLVRNRQTTDIFKLSECSFVPMINVP